MGWGVYHLFMKRYKEERPLCVAEENTCNNLAGMKERKKDGTWRYHTLCDTHRRHGHSGMTMARTKRSKRFIPLNKCDMCNETAEERHRVLSGSTYDKFNVLTLCKDCHLKIHKLYKKFSTMGFHITRVT